MTATHTRARDLGLPLPGTPGPHNAITDVPGVEVGFSTVKSLAAAPGDRQIYTGVTAVLPRGHSRTPNPMWAGQFDFNGNGEMTGTHWIADAGYFLGPVCLTNTHSIGIVHHATVGWMIEQYAEHFRHHAWAMPVVAETYDGLVNAVKSLEAEIASLPAKPEELLNIARRGMELRAELNFLFESSEGNFVYWFERRAKGVFVAATPIDVSTLLRERLFEPFETIVLTSATLAVGGRFDFLKQRLGVHMASERVLPSEFDFPTQALLYIPSSLPDVRDPAFPERAAEVFGILRARRRLERHRRQDDLVERGETTKQEACCLWDARVPAECGAQFEKNA